MSIECLKITARHNKDEKKEKINHHSLITLIFEALFDVFLNVKNKNSLEWLVVIDVTKRSNIAKIYKCISKIDDT